MDNSIAQRFLAEQVNRHAHTKVELIEVGRVRDYRQAIDDAPQDLSCPIPPLFLLTLGRTRRPHMNRLPGGTANASDEFEFYQDVFVGEAIEIDTRVVSVEKKTGGSRELYLITSETSYRKSSGELAAKRINRILRWE